MKRVRDGDVLMGCKKFGILEVWSTVIILSLVQTEGQGDIKNRTETDTGPTMMADKTSIWS